MKDKLERVIIDYKKGLIIAISNKGKVVCNKLSNKWAKTGGKDEDWD